MYGEAFPAVDVKMSPAGNFCDMLAFDFYKCKILVSNKEIGDRYKENQEGSIKCAKKAGGN